MLDLVWLLAGIGLVVAEMFTLTIVLGLLGAAALVTAAAAFLGAPALVQGLVFAGSSVALLAFARPPMQRMLLAGEDGSHTDARALTGSTAMVVRRSPT